MNFTTLKYFLTVAQEGNFTAAAYKLYISQQALSEQIKKLEAELGTSLFIRSRPLELTKAGKIFEEGAKKILTVQQEVIDGIAATLTQDERRLTLAISTYEMPPYLPEMLDYFSQQHPNISISITKRRESDVSENMDGISFYFSMPNLNPSLEHIYLIRSDLNCVVVRQSVLNHSYGAQWPEIEAQLKETGDLRLLREIPFVVLQDKNEMMHPYTESVFRAFDMTPKISFRSDNGELNTSVCLQGKGARIGPFNQMYYRFRDCLDTGTDPMRLFFLRTKRNSVPIAISYQKKKQLSWLEDAFATSMREFVVKTFVECGEMFGSGEDSLERFYC